MTEDEFELLVEDLAGTFVVHSTAKRQTEIDGFHKAGRLILEHLGNSDTRQLLVRLGDRLSDCPRSCRKSPEQLANMVLVAQCWADPRQIPIGPHQRWQDAVAEARKRRDRWQ